MNRVEQKKYRLLSNVLYVYKGVARYKPYLVGLLVISIACTVGNKFIWLFLSKYIIEYITMGIQASELIRIVLILTLSNILCMIGLNAVNFGKEPAAFYVRPMFMLKRNIKYIGMFYENLEDREVLDAVERSKAATRNVDVGIEGIIRLTLEFCTSVFTCLIALILLCRISVVMAGAVLIFGGLSYFSINKASQKEKEYTIDAQTYSKRKLEYFNRISNDYSYGKDIRVYQLADRLLKTQEELQQEIHGGVYKAKIQWLRSGMFTNLLDLLREALMYGGLVYFILQGIIGIGDFMLYVGCVHNLSEAFYQLLKTYAKLKKCSNETNDYRSLDEFCEEEKGGIAEFSEKAYEIYFENVSFQYPGSETFALKDINMRLSPHERLAVVGLNGAGKTTFIKLLLKLYKPTEGKIYLNGIDINNLDTKKYYQLFSPVFQDMECYAFSLAENVSMNCEEETDKVYAGECLAKAGLGEKLNTLESGMDTPVLKVLSEKGIELSGGEKQKLALARAIYKKAPIVILDEPTAALDAMAENKMYEQFDSLIDKKTAVYISHRLASTRFCDHIALIENGEMKEYGTHDSLLQQNGRYAEMFRMQSQYYREGEADEKECC